MRNSLAITAALLLIAAMFAGCASTPMASAGSDADAKRFETAMNAAVIYIYRPTGYGGHGVSTIWVDGRLIGETLPGTYFRVPTRPGRTRVTVSGNDMGRLEIDTKAEGVYYVETQVAGETQSESTTVFRAVAPNVGQAAIQGCCRMLEAWRPGQNRLNF